MFGGTILNTDNSGNVYKGAFDPHCNCTDEKWKIHHESNAFGAPQSEDPMADKYYMPETAHGSGEFYGEKVPDELNQAVLDSVKDRPMTWNLWNVVRHYVYIKYFKNQNKVLDSQAAWDELEQRTQKYVKSIYRTFQENKHNPSTLSRTTFGDTLGGGSSTNSGTMCSINWTNSFLEISSMLETNARQHQASFVLFTGDVQTPSSQEADRLAAELANAHPSAQGPLDYLELKRIAVAQYKYDEILNSVNNFRITTTEDIDCYDGEDGIPLRTWDSASGKWVAQEDVSGKRVYQGFKYGDMPTTYVIGDSNTYAQRLPDVDKQFTSMVDLDVEYPEAEFYLNDTTRKWVKRIRHVVMNRQVIPVYTSMENMEKSHHDLTLEDMKSITFQVVPQFYWKYEWSYNEFMIHRVGKLNSPSTEIVMYDMLGNVWEWVRDDWSTSIASLNNKVNPIVGTIGNSASTKKVIKGGAFDQFIRKVLSSSREGLEQNGCVSENGTQANVGFRPSMMFTGDALSGDFQAG
jgi:hypothetical protein